MTDLLKQLEEAGFPYKNPADHPYMPELGELMRACGVKFRKVTLHSENAKHPGLIWQATANQYTAGNKSERGATPEEAVARLWLALNRK